MSFIPLIGLVAGTITTISFVPQIIKTWKTKSAKDLSLGMFLIYCTGIVLWLIYGVIVNDVPLIIGNSLTLLLSSILLFFNLTFKS